MAGDHIKLEQLSYCKQVKKWLADRYGAQEGTLIWEKVASAYNSYLEDLPLLCNSDFFCIEQLHGTLIRCGTCGNCDRCDYRVVGNRNPLAAGYRIETDEGGFLVSREIKK